ncbi:MAG TPA: uroporphyrinogen decarboxylase [Bacteroidota bacterium]|nr:uroporphyrinogen decarboxylase [Bacteroidota bacterium]
MTNDLFLRACKRQQVDRTPVWMMRQAGRYLPQYRAVRAKTDFLSMCKTPELAAEVTIQPVDILGVDAAIIFSDILVVPEAMGMELRMVESQGPQFPRPIRTADDVRGLKTVDPERDLRFVMDAIAAARRGLNGRVPLIGFAGSPWTLAAYMIEGSGSREFPRIKAMMLDEPDLLQLLLEKLTLCVRTYLEAQIASGAQAVQIFDTWGGILDPDHYKKFSLDPMFEIVSNLHKDGAPVIVFSKGANHALREISEIGADVVGLDWTIDIAAAREETGHRVALQGNLDPAFLYGSPESIRREVRSILRKFGKGPGHVFNLGHGIFPDVPPEHALAMIRAVHEESPSFHA